MTTVQVKLPDMLAQSAEAADLLSEEVATAFMNDPANAGALADEKLWDITIGDGFEEFPV